MSDSASPRRRRPARPGDDGRAARGRAAEDRVALELERNGWTVLGRNLRTRRGEIDILARRGDVLHVVEVRSRVGTAQGDPVETIDARKRARIDAAVRSLARDRRLPPFREVRYDVASVVWESPDAEPRVAIFENAFDAVDLM